MVGAFSNDDPRSEESCALLQVKSLRVLHQTRESFGASMQCNPSRNELISPWWADDGCPLVLPGLAVLLCLWPGLSCRGLSRTS